MTRLTRSQCYVTFDGVAGCLLAATTALSGCGGDPGDGSSDLSKRQWCEIYEVAVDASRRRRGVVRALIERAVAHARELGIEAVELSTWAFNETAHAAFASIGFEPVFVRYELKARS